MKRIMIASLSRLVDRGAPPAVGCCSVWCSEALLHIHCYGQNLFPHYSETLSSSPPRAGGEALSSGPLAHSAAAAAGGSEMK